MKKLGCLVVVVVLLAAAVVLLPAMSRDAVRERLAEELSLAAGMEVAIDAVDVELLKSRAELRGLRLINDPAVAEGDALAVQTLYVRYKLLSLLSDTMVLPEVSLHIDHLTVVRSKTGDTNLDPLIGDSLDELFTRTGAGRPSSSGPPAEAPPTPSGSPSPAPPGPDSGSTAKAYRIDSLTLKLDRMEVVDYAQGGPEPMRITIPVAYDATYTNVTDLNAISDKIGMDIAIQAAPTVLQQGVMSLLGETPDERRETLRNLEDQVKGLLDQFR